MKAGGSTSVELDDQAMDCCFHPSKKVVAASLINGGIRLLECSGATPRETASYAGHSDSCRSLHFMAGGTRIIRLDSAPELFAKVDSGSADHSVLVYDVATQKPALRLATAHVCGVERVLPLSEHTFASGDQDGLLRLWDARQNHHTAEFSSHSDFVTDMTHHETESCLLTVSGDGTLSVNDLRTNKVRARSEEDADDELSCVVVLKSGKKVVCGSQLGALTIFSWGQFADCSDRLPGHPASVDCVLKLDEDTVITGSGDGVIRVLSVQPHALLGVLGEQEEGGCERLSLSHDRRLLASTSYGPSLELWDTACLDEDADDEEGAGEMPEAEADSSEEEKTSKKKRRGKQKKGSSAKKLKQSATGSKTAGFFKDLL